MSIENTVLITGASRGIGRAIAEKFSENDWFVLGTATSDAGVSELNRHFKKGKAYQLDVADPASINNLAAELTRDAYQPMVLINNAGITRDNLLMRMSDEDWEMVLQTNLSGLFRMCKIFFRAMLKARHGRIINIGSVVAALGNAGQINYSAAKAGIEGFTRSFAREVGSRGVTVNCVSPGFIRSDMTAKLKEEQRANMLKHIPLARFGEGREVADLVFFLASDAASYITGQTVHINGGMYMG